MPHILDGQPLTPGQPFAVADIQYPANVLELWSEADLAAIGVTWQAPPAPTLADLKSSRNAAVTARRDQAFAAGFAPAAGPLAGHRLQVRNETDKINWLTSATSYSAAVSMGAGLVQGATFRTMANETVVTTYAEAVSIIVQDMAGWGQAIMQRSWDLKDAIEAAADQDALTAIDIETGWP